MSIGNFPRQRLTEGTQRPIQSATTEPVFLPLAGFTPSTPEVLSQPESLISTQNVWIHEHRLLPRWKLSAQSVSNASSGATYSAVLPLMSIDSVSATYGKFWIASGGTGAGTGLALGYYDTSVNKLNWLPISYNSQGNRTSWATGTGFTGSIDTAKTWHGAEVYHAPTNQNLMVMSAGTQEKLLAFHPLFYSATAGGPLLQLQFSAISGSTPRCRDVTNFGDRIVAWNCDSISNRVQWHAEGDVTDWTGIGSGYQDLADARGEGTRIFSTEDQLILATTREFWRGRSVGFPYIFQFSPLNRQIGIPYERAAIQTPFGIFWLGDGAMIWRMQGEQITPFGDEVQHWLYDRLHAPEYAFFTFNRLLNHLRLFYSTSTTQYPTDSLTYSFEAQAWTHEYYGGHQLTCGTSGWPLDSAQSYGSGGGSDLVWSKLYPADLYEVVITSTGSVGQPTQSAASDLGTAVEEDATFGTLLSDNWARKARLIEARLDLTADSASSATFSYSTTFGVTSAFSQRLAISANSNTSQMLLYPKVSGGPYWTPRIQSTNGMWRLRRVYTKFEDDGEAR